MLIATAVVSVLLAVLLAAAALRKLSHRRDVVESYRRAGVPEHRLNQLAVILLAGAAGLLAGLAWPPVGAAAAIGLIGYFAVAIACHIRADDAKRLPTPIGYGVIAALALVLRLVTW